MTPILATAAVIWGVSAAIITTHSIVRCVRPYAGTPSPCERDAQDGRGEVGEIQTNHNGSIY